MTNTPASLTDLVDAIAEKHAELSKAKLKAILEDAVEETAARLQAKGKVRIHKFGTFETSTRGERQGRNPKTGEPMTIAASTAARFKPAANLKALS